MAVPAGHVVARAEAADGSCCVFGSRRLEVQVAPLSHPTYWEELQQVEGERLPNNFMALHAPLQSGAPDAEARHRI